LSCWRRGIRLFSGIHSNKGAPRYTPTYRRPCARLAYRPWVMQLSRLVSVPDALRVVLCPASTLARATARRDTGAVERLLKSVPCRHGGRFPAARTQKAPWWRGCDGKADGDVKSKRKRCDQGPPQGHRPSASILSHAIGRPNTWSLFRATSLLQWPRWRWKGKPV
jgi:hypothetical protein